MGNLWLSYTRLWGDCWILKSFGLVFLKQIELTQILGVQISSVRWLTLRPK